MKISKSMKNESLPFLCFCATRFTAVAAFQAYGLYFKIKKNLPLLYSPWEGL